MDIFALRCNIVPTDNSVAQNDDTEDNNESGEVPFRQTVNKIN